MERVSLPAVTIQGTDAKSITLAVDTLSRQIKTVEDNIRLVVKEAEKLLESKRDLESDRERLVQRRNALRNAARELEDSE
jgi:uncharacterized protein YoxC